MEKIEGERIRLRRLKPSDAKDVYENVKDEEVIRWLVNVPYPYPFDEAVKFIRRTRYRLRKRIGFAFGIVLKETNRVIGVVDLFNIDWDSGNAEVGYWIGTRYRNLGLMTEALRLMLKFAFEGLKLQRVSAKVFEENPASKRVLEKNGFKLEGRRRGARLKFGRWHDELLYGILKSDYEIER